MKKCRNCSKRYEPHRPLQTVCSPKCAYEYASTQDAKDFRRSAFKRETLAKKRELNEADRAYWIARVDKEFNKFIRLRDGNKCCTCGAENRQIQAGHYIPKGRGGTGTEAGQRWSEKNCHSQCTICNNHKSGNLGSYRKFMLKKYGPETLAEIERDTITHMTIDEMKSLEKHYNAINKETENAIG
eukprot:GHVR01063544.1.p1 GENE.GHVR01063544.1~~GHVR01063544.1.p1  ORF type:complete len:185 (-),score=6.26 GHVR01063544.1:66-620(-)